MPPADITMATFYNGDKNKEKAEEYLNRALKTGAKDFRTRLAAANFMLQNNRLKEAQIHADEAAKLDSKSIDAKIVAGVIARIKGDLKAARSYLDDANRQSPSNFTAMNQLALVLIEGDKDSQQRALEYAETNYRSNPKNVEAVSTLGWVNLKLNRMKEAEQALNAVGATGNLNADQLYYFAYAWKDTPKAPDGIKFLEAALNADRPFAYRQQATKLLSELKSKNKGKDSDDEKGTSDTKKSSPKKGTAKSGSKSGTDKVGSQK
jgi:tetratricopeptide (TPR) repeat protein